MTMMPQTPFESKSIHKNPIFVGILLQVVGFLLLGFGTIGTAIGIGLIIWGGILYRKEYKRRKQAESDNTTQNKGPRTKHIIYNCASIAVYICGWLWMGSAFVATKGAWWNSILVGIGIFGLSTVLAWRAVPTTLGIVMFVLGAATTVLIAIAFGPSLLH